METGGLPVPITSSTFSGFETFLFFPLLRLVANRLTRLGFLILPQSDVIRKPQGQIKVSATSSIARGEGKQILQVFSLR